MSSWCLLHSGYLFIRQSWWLIWKNFTQFLLLGSHFLGCVGEYRIIGRFWERWILHVFSDRLLYSGCTRCVSPRSFSPLAAQFALGLGHYFYGPLFLTVSCWYCCTVTWVILGDDFWICRIQRFLVRQWLHLSVCRGRGEFHAFLRERGFRLQFTEAFGRISHISFLREGDVHGDFWQTSMAKSSSSSIARGGGDAGSQTPRRSATPIECMHWRFMDKHGRHMPRPHPPGVSVRVSTTPVGQHSFCSVALAVDMLLHGECDSGAAKRRRERRLRSWLKHERQTVRMALAEALHHSSGTSPSKRDTRVVEGARNDA